MKKSLVFFLVALLAAPILTHADETADSYEMYQWESAFIIRICGFSTWPGIQDPNKPFIISIIGKIPRGQYQDILKYNTVMKRKIIIREINDPGEIKDSDVLFIASSEGYRLDEILRFIEGRPILTFGDTKGFAKKGVMINFYLKRGSPAFEINPNAIKKSFIQVHPQLYAIGKEVGSEKPLNSKEKEANSRGEAR
jgi:hypothetical protein